MGDINSLNLLVIFGFSSIVYVMIRNVQASGSDSRVELDVSSFDLCVVITTKFYINTFLIALMSVTECQTLFILGLNLSVALPLIRHI